MLNATFYVIFKHCVLFTREMKLWAMTYTPEGEKYSAWVKNDAFSMRRSVGIKNSTIIILEIPRRKKQRFFLKEKGETKNRTQGTKRIFTDEFWTTQKHKFLCTYIYTIFINVK